MRRLFIDCETSPNVVFSWRTGRKIFIDYQNIIKERSIICICYKWENDKKVKFLRWDKDENDKSMLERIIPVLNEADELVGHNIEGFDLPWMRTRAMFHGIVTNSHYKCIDTLKFAKTRLYCNSNKLDYLARYLGIGAKIKTEFDLWKNVVLKNDKGALNRMIRYCKMDVILLEKVYHKLADHMASHTHAGVLVGNDKWTCAKCGSSDVKVSKTNVTAMGMMRHQMQCRKCGHYYTVSIVVYENYLLAKKEEAKRIKKLKEALKKECKHIKKG